jgi:hypothetical protein
MRRFLRQAVVAAITVGLGTGGALAAQPERPFFGKAEYSVVSVGECDPGVAGILPPELSEGTMIATHMGLSEISMCIVVTAPPVGSSVPFAGQGIVTAANGDQINFTVSGASEISADPCVPEGTVVVFGGTGRFAGASGVIHFLSATPWSVPGTCGPDSTSELSGTITY